jgi:hypothetical protein
MKKKNSKGYSFEGIEKNLFRSQCQRTVKHFIHNGQNLLYQAKKTKEMVHRT